MIFILQVDVFNVIFWVLFRFIYVTGTIWDTFPLSGGIPHGRKSKIAKIPLQQIKISLFIKSRKKRYLYICKGK